MRRPTDTEVREVVRRVLAELPQLADSSAVGAPGPAYGPSPREASGAPASAPVTPASRSAGAVALGADHGGFALKQRLAQHLRGRGVEVVDLGTGSAEAVDYPDFAHRVAGEVAAGRCRVGIVVDGAGIGSCMAANKVPGIRAALCYDLSSARNSREHNHANVLTLGAGLIGEALAVQIVDAWLDTPWGGDRHARRVAKIMAIEQQYLREAGPAGVAATSSAASETAGARP
jgi:ribose 5-phosphate isomerase B